VLNKALTPGFFGRHDTKTPVKASAAALVVNIIIAVALMKTLGHVGIALATSVSAWLNAITLGVILLKRGHLQPDARLKRRLPRVILATALMAAAVYGGLQFILQYYWALFGAPGAASGNNLTRGVALVLLIGGGGLVFAVSALMLGAAERSDLAQFKRKRA